MQSTHEESAQVAKKRHQDELQAAAEKSKQSVPRYTLPASTGHFSAEAVQKATALEKQLVAARSAAQASQSTLSRKLSEQEAKLKQLETVHAEEISRYQPLPQQLKTALRRASHLEKELDESRERSSELRSQMDAVEAERRKQAAAGGSLALQNLIGDTHIEEKQDAISSLQAALEAAEQEAEDAANAEAEAAEVAAVAAEQEERNRLAKLTRLERELHQQEILLVEKDAELKRRGDEVAALHKDLSIKEDETRKLQGEVSRERMSLEEAGAASAWERESLRKEREGLQAKLSDCGELIATLRQRISVGERQQKETKSALIETQTQLQASNSAFAASEASASADSDAASSLQGRLSTALQKASVLENRILQEANKGLQELEHERAFSESLQAQLASESKHLANASQRCAELEHRCGELQSKLDQGKIESLEEMREAEAGFVEEISQNKLSAAAEIASLHAKAAADMANAKAEAAAELSKVKTEDNASLTEVATRAAAERASLEARLEASTSLQKRFKVEIDAVIRREGEAQVTCASLEMECAKLIASLSVAEQLKEEIKSKYQASEEARIELGGQLVRSETHNTTIRLETHASTKALREEYQEAMGVQEDQAQLLTHEGVLRQQLQDELTEAQAEIRALNRTATASSHDTARQPDPKQRREERPDENLAARDGATPSPLRKHIPRASSASRREMLRQRRDALKEHTHQLEEELGESFAPTPTSTAWPTPRRSVGSTGRGFRVNLRDAFDELDSNNDGVISREEFNSGRGQ